MPNIKQNAKNPAINIQITHYNDNKRYWLYYYNNGYVYISEGNYENWLFKHSDNIFEFRVPLGEKTNMSFGTKIKTIRVFIQDIDNKCISCGDITSGEYIINYNFNIYTAYKEVTLKKDENYTLDIEISVDNAKYQWQLNGENINNANEEKYEIKKANQENIGIYSVKISAHNGQEKIVDICKVKDVV